MQAQTLIIIPTYNEALNIAKLIDSIFVVAPQVHLLIMDDNSPDGTAKIIETLQQKYPHNLNLMVRPGKMGLASAYITGFKWGLKRKDLNWFLEMDADFSHDPKYLQEFFQHQANYDFIIGSRYVAGGGVVNWPWHRRLLSRGGSLYARTILNTRIHDFTGGFNCWTRQVLESIGLDSIQSQGYSFQIELKYRSHLKGFRFKEFPIIFADREEGVSKMSKKIVFEAVFKVLTFRFQRYQ